MNALASEFSPPLTASLPAATLPPPLLAPGNALPAWVWRHSTAGTTLQHCVLLALLLHVWAVLMFGNAPGGTAEPGQGVGGSLNITLQGPPTAKRVDPTATVEPVPVVPTGPVGSAAQARWGGVVRDSAPPEASEPGTARLGQWAATATLPAPQATAPEPPTATAPMAPLGPALPTAPLAPVPPVARQRTEAQLQPLPAAPAAAPALQAAGRGLATPAPPTATLAPLPTLAPPPAAPSALVSSLPAVAPKAPAMTAATTPAQAPYIAAVPQPTAPPPPLPALAPTPAPSLAASPTPVVTVLPAPDKSQATATLPVPTPAPVPDPQRSLASTLTRSTAANPADPINATGRSAVPPLPAVATPAALAPLLPAAASALQAAPAPAAAPAAATPAAPPAVAGAAGTSTSSTPPAQPAAAATPAPQAAAATLPRPAPSVSLGPVGAPDAGTRQGADIATPASASASAPARLNLQLNRPRGGELSRLPSPGVLQLLPRPPEVPDKLAEEIKKAGKSDCKNVHANMGLLAVVPLVIDAARKDGGCKW